MTKQMTTAQTIREMVECDDCGRRTFRDVAEQITYTCPAVRVAYICRRCQRGETPIIVTSGSWGKR